MNVATITHHGLIMGFPKLRGMLVGVLILLMDEILHHLGALNYCNS